MAATHSLDQLQSENVSVARQPVATKPPTCSAPASGPRSTPELQQQVQMLMDQVWFNQQLDRRNRIVAGTEQVDEEVWKDIVANGRQVEATYGYDNEYLSILGDYDRGFHDGMITALRWAIGETWAAAHDFRIGEMEPGIKGYTLRSFKDETS